MIRYSKRILDVVILLFVLSVGCTQTALNDSNIYPTGESTSTHNETTNHNKVIFTPTITPIITPTIVNAPVEMLVPYSKTSVWNTSIGPLPKYDSHSQEMIANLVLANDGEIIMPSTYNYPVYFADVDTPRWDVPCTVYRCTVAFTDGVVIRTDILENVPIPPNAQPTPDSDGRMVIIDKVTHAEYDFWRAEHVETGWTAANGSVYNILWNGTPTIHTSRGAGIPSYAGLLRPWEIFQGRILNQLRISVCFLPQKQMAIARCHSLFLREHDSSWIHP